MSDDRRQWKLAVHGPVVELHSTVAALDSSIDSLVDEFSVPGWSETFDAILGSIRPYEGQEVLGRLPQNARHLSRTADLIDIYEQGDRFWLVDERWGMSEINLHTGQWMSWVLPQPKLDPLRLAEFAVLWPLAQLLRAQGLHLLPAVSAVREGFAVLILAPFGLAPELTALISSGYKLIGQRWTALREEDGRLALLHLPGRVERFSTPRLRFGTDDDQSWLDLTAEHPGSRQNHAFCDAVLVAEPGRRPKAHLRETNPADALNLLRHEWPIVSLGTQGPLYAGPTLLADNCRCFQVQLSRNTKDLLALLNSIRYAGSEFEGQSAAA